MNIDFAIRDRGTMIVYYENKKAKIGGEAAYEPTRFFAWGDTFTHWESPYENIPITEKEKEEIINYITKNSEVRYNIKVIFV